MTDGSNRCYTVRARQRTERIIIILEAGKKGETSKMIDVYTLTGEILHNSICEMHYGGCRWPGFYRPFHSTLADRLQTFPAYKTGYDLIDAERSSERSVRTENYVEHMFRFGLANYCMTFVRTLRDHTTHTHRATASADVGDSREWN